MRGARNLWVSIVFIAVLVLGSIAAFATGTRPVLGLDLQGGLSVILAAPPGTPTAVMQQALENIRRRVDALGVGEPLLYLSGTNIEVQLPGLAPGKVTNQSKSLYCIVNDDASSNYGCAADQTTAAKALTQIRIQTNPTTVCVTDANGNVLGAPKGSTGTPTASTASAGPSPSASESASPSPASQGLCFADQSSADTAKSGITVSAKSSPTPSATPSVSGPQPGLSQYCLTGTGGTQYTCYKTEAQANAAQKSLKTKVTGNSYCLTGQPKPAPSPTPTPSATQSPKKARSTPSPKTKSSPSASPGTSPTPAPRAFTQLSTSEGAVQLPCGTSKTKAQAELAGLKVNHVTTEYCVVSSAGKNLGCFLTQSAAAAEQKLTGEQHVLDVIGTTARLEERQVKSLVQPTDPTYASLAVTCPTAAEQATPACSFDALANQQIVVQNTNASAAPVGKYVLGPVIISGTDIKKATAVYQTATTTNSQVGWTVNFQLSSSGARAFASATEQAVSASSPQNQIAIVVDRHIISSPTVQSAITGGSGVIQGNFTESTSKDLATQLNSGALPVELSRQQVSTVSPTLGSQSLRQGLIAALVGLILLMLYLAFYYRLLGIVTWFGMTIWAVFALALVSILGHTAGYSLTLAGVAGLVVSLGITADSYIVFYERLKDEVRRGKTPRSAIQPAFKRAFRTIITADIVTALAAGILYLLAIGSVRGFALTLGLATMLDVFVVYFFKRPTVFLLANSRKLANIRGFGLAAATASEEATLA